jgi:hypothetical protein
MKKESLKALLWEGLPEGTSAPDNFYRTIKDFKKSILYQV